MYRNFNEVELRAQKLHININWGQSSPTMELCISQLRNCDCVVAGSNGELFGNEAGIHIQNE